MRRDVRSSFLTGLGAVLGRQTDSPVSSRKSTRAGMHNRLGRERLLRHSLPSLTHLQIALCSSGWTSCRPSSKWIMHAKVAQVIMMTIAEHRGWITRLFLLSAFVGSAVNIMNKLYQNRRGTATMVLRGIPDTYTPGCRPGSKGHICWIYRKVLSDRIKNGIRCTANGLGNTSLAGIVGAFHRITAGVGNGLQIHHTHNNR